MTPARRALRVSLLTSTLLVASIGIAHAGPIKVGEGMEALETDDKGNLTSEGQKTAVKELDRIPGEDAWDFTMYAELGGQAAEGPIYIEFRDKIMGEWQLVYRHEDSAFDGSRKYRTNFVLEGNVGFNTDHTYRIKVVQVGANGKDIELANGQIKLIDTGREPEVEESGGEEEEISEQDKLDSFAGGDEDEASEGGADAPAGDAGPPEVEPKKGCSVERSGTDVGLNGLLVLALVGGAAFGRRRRQA